MRNKITLRVAIFLLIAGGSAGVIVLNASTASAQTADTNTWVTDGTVSAIAPGPNNITYIGGSFTYVGPSTGPGAPLDRGNGLPVNNFPQISDSVSASIKAASPDGSGGWYIGGRFNTVGTVTRNELAHILSDGSVDPNWDPNANGNVNAIAVSGTTIYVGGIFTTIGGTTRNRLAAIDTAGTLTSWNPNAGNTVNAIAVSGTTIYVGGAFTTIGGTTRNRLAAIDTAGTLTSWNPNANSTVSAIALTGSIVYTGGKFTTIGGVVRPNLAQFTPNIQFTFSSSSGSESTTPANIELTLSSPVSLDITVNYAVAGASSATGGGVDYTLASTGTATISAGNTTTTIPIVIIDDALAEPGGEIIIIDISSPTNNATLGINTRHTYTILDNDTSYTFPRDVGTTYINGPPRQNALPTPALTTPPKPAEITSLLKIPPPILFTKNFSFNSRSPDVRILQKFLNDNNFLVAKSGPGSPGYETDLLGPLTRAALIKFQEAYADKILTPVGLKKGTGYFGPSTRAFLNSLRGR